MKHRGAILLWGLVLILLSNTRCNTHNSKKTKLENIETSFNPVKDSLWLKMYRTINNEVIAPKIRAVLIEISNQENIQMNSIGLFNMLVQNYNCESLTTDDFLIKYPFVNKTFIKNSFDSLVNLNLLDEKESIYKLTPYGLKIVALLKEKITTNDTTNHNSLVAILAKISSNALSKDFDGINKSLQNRKLASLRFENSSCSFAKLVTGMGDLIALRNDQAHYRHKFITDDKKLNMASEHPKKEILGSTFYYGYFEENRFKNRPTWGHSSSETLSFLYAMEKDGLLFKTDTIWKLTPLGKEIESKASKMMEDMFYKPWYPLEKHEINTLKILVDE